MIWLAFILTWQWYALYLLSVYRAEQARDRLLATHEVGHSLLVWSCSGALNFTSATINEPNGGGMTRWMHQHDDNDDDLWCVLTIALAGVVAEQMFLGNASILGAEQDMRDAFKYSATLLQRGSLTPPWIVSEPSDRMILGKHFQTATDEQLMIVDRAAETARNIIRAYSFKTHEFIKALMRKKVMREGDVGTILGFRESIRFYRIMSTFVVSKRVLEEGGTKEAV